MREHRNLWLTLVVGVCLIPVAVVTGDGGPAVIAAIFILSSLIGFAYGSAGEEDPSTSVLQRRRSQRAGRGR